MAFRYMTQKEQDKAYDKMVETAKKWFIKGYSVEVIAKGIWNKFGYRCSAKDGKIFVCRTYNNQPNTNWFESVITFND